MPLYEWHCLSCDETFEGLASLSESGSARDCPRCGASSPRAVSRFALVGKRDVPDRGARPKATGNSASQPPVCLRYPHVPLLCHMDPKAAKRALAYANGVGPRYDERVAKREELRKKRGEPPAGASDGGSSDTGGEGAHNYRRHGTTHAHSHGHHHGHSHTHMHTHTHTAGD